NTHVEEGNGGCRTRKDRGDHFVAFLEPCQQVGEVKRIRSRSDSKCLATGPESLCKFLFELSHARALSNPPSAENFSDAFYCRLGNMRIKEHDPFAFLHHGEFVHRFFLLHGHLKSNKSAKI